MSVRKRAGVTMVELLVVISVIAMLVAILLPAVNMAREAARNTQCRNRIKQLAVAVNSYQTRRNAYPGYRSLLDGQPVSWVVRLAPDFGERNLYEGWRKAIAAGSTQSAPRPHVPLLTCPSDPGVLESEPALSYMANAGHGDDAKRARTINLPQYGVFLDHLPREEGTPIPSTTDAFLNERGDGAGKTILLAENVQLPFRDGRVGTRWDVADYLGSNVVLYRCFYRTEGFGRPQDFQFVRINPRHRRSRGRWIRPTTARPASHHSGGANIAFCDTRVTFIRDDTDYRVYVRLMAPHDEGIKRHFDACDKCLGPLSPINSTDYE